MRFDVFTREEVHFLRDIINFYINAEQRKSDPDGLAIGKRLVREMRRSMKWLEPTR